MIQGYVERIPDSNTNAIQHALVMMRQASLLVRRLDAYFASHGLSQLRFLVMIVIDREPDRTDLYANEIADRIDVSRPVLTRALKSLDQEGLISSKADESDGRAKRISLTRKGQRRLDAILPGYFREICDFMEQQKVDV